MGWIIGAWFSVVMLVVIIMLEIQTYLSNNSVMPQDILAIGLMLMLAIICFKKHKDLKSGATARKKAIKEKKAEEMINANKLIPGSKERINELGASVCIPTKHMAGLPLGEGSNCFLYLCEDKIIIEKNSSKYNLSWEKIIDATMKSDVEIHKSYVSSVGGAVGGALLFGPLGAIVGGRVKEKKNSIGSMYLIFTYYKDEKVDYISFDVTGLIKAKKFVDFFNQKDKAKIEVEL